MKSRPRYWTSPALMHRAFANDVLAGGRMRLIATIHDPGVIRRIRAHRGLAPASPFVNPALLCPDLPASKLRRRKFSCLCAGARCHQAPSGLILDLSVPLCLARMLPGWASSRGSR